MPNYDYECQECGYIFEVFQKITDKPLSKCPKCQGKVKRLIGKGAGLIFKGSGFYATDYKKPASAENASSEVKPKKENKSPQPGKNENKTNN